MDDCRAAKERMEYVLGSAQLMKTDRPTIHAWLCASLHMGKDFTECEHDTNEAAPRAQFNPLAAFEQENGLPNFIPKNLIEEHTFSIECAAEEPDTKQFKLTNGCLLVEVPVFMHPPMEFGDHIIGINDEHVEDRIHFHRLIRFLAAQKKHQRIRFTVQRVISSVPISKSRLTVPKELISKQHCDYFKNTMIFYPRSSLGTNIKSVNGKVYVMTTDNGFNSIARRAFYIGDALLSVNDTPCTSTKQASKLLLDALKTKGIKDLMAVQARVIVERPVNPAAIAIVKAVLYMKTANVMDPKMPDDVVAICKFVENV
ncbi:hypothetical protein KIN20_016777 [Parelaphostrongylus tenuis]|uniref:PDZ domain-containing protein n=1 Tax=Parelaphostrongylus tenuis TaxID=148309 RepID=A0AAD5QTD5_PARTN|nr:hypothetical protein KIN20_016777 [Parelaphostrongylus tenuis]